MRWRWQQLTVDRTVVAESRSSYDKYERCVAVAQRLHRDHDVLGGRARRDDLLDLRNLFAWFDFRSDDDDERRAHRFLPLPREHFRRRVRLACLQRLRHELAELRALLALDHD